MVTKISFPVWGNSLSTLLHMVFSLFCAHSVLCKTQWSLKLCTISRNILLTFLVYTNAFLISHPRRVIKIKWSSTWGELAETLLWSAKVWKTLETLFNGKHSKYRKEEWGLGHGSARSRFEGDYALFITIQHTAHWFNGNTILSLDLRKQRPYFSAYVTVWLDNPLTDRQR